MTAKKTNSTTKRKAAPRKKAVSRAKASTESSARVVVRKTPQARADKVDYYPNRMTLAVSVLAGTILVLVTVIAVLGSRG